MTYTVQEQYTSKNSVPGADANSVWGLGPRRVTSITIHHWGAKGQQFDTVRDFLCTNNSPTSAHYVAQDGLVACIVSPDDCAFHAGNPEGNTFSIGIECRPEATDGDYATVAELIASIRAIYGDVPLYPHNHWFNTACPGDYDLGRLDSLARGSAAVAPDSTSIKPIEGFLMALTDAQQADLYNRISRYLDAPVSAIPDKVWGQTVLRGGQRISVKQELADAKTAAQQGLNKSIDVKALAAQLAATLTTNQAHQFIVALGQALPKA